MSERIICYITPEVTLDRDLKFYSGGLGEVAGSIARSAYAMNKSMVGVSLLYSQGYYEQGLDPDRGMTISYRNYPVRQLLRNTGKRCEIRIEHKVVYADIWENPAGQYGAIPFYFLDTDIDANDHLGRINTQQLYGGSEMTGRNMKRMIAQNMVLGIGAVEAMRVLGYDVELYHLNESHAVFAPLYLLCCALTTGKNYEEAVAQVRNIIVFTNHTPIAAGNPQYSHSLMLELLGLPSGIWSAALKKLGGDEFFDTTVACLRLARKANAVSERHLQTCKQIWGDITDSAPWTWVTNGVTTSYWQHPKFAVAHGAVAIHNAKIFCKRLMIHYLMGRSDKIFKANVLTIGWFRRFTGYKRPGLLFRDREWIENHLRSGNMQIVIGGKPHPDDNTPGSGMVGLWNYLYALSQEYPNLAILAGYDPLMSKVMKVGVDVWLSSPRVPQEACSTSGMSAAMNGANLMSTPDGWIREIDQDAIFPYGTHIPSGYEQDAFDANALRNMFDEIIIPMYYHDKHAWYRKAARIKKIAEDQFNSTRMLIDYYTRVYTS